jgi:hypothetical protein
MGTPCAALCSGPTTHFPSVRSAIYLSAHLNCTTGLDYPYITALLPDQTIQAHDIESQEIAQVLPPPPPPSLNDVSPSALLGAERRALSTSSNGFFVPLQQRPDKLMLKKINLLSRNAKPGGREVVPAEQEQPEVTGDTEETEAHEVVDIPEESVTPYDL